MKRLCLALLLLLIAALPAQADIIPKDMKSIYVSAVIQNISDYPGFAFVQLETLGDEVRAKTLIGPKGLVNKGYKLNRLEILAIPRPLFDSLGGLDGLDNALLRSDERIARSTGTAMESGQQLVARPSSMAGKDVYYNITSIDAGVVHLQKTGETIYEEHPNHYPLNLFAYGFAITIAVELLVFMVLLRFVFRTKTPGAIRAFVCVLVAQTATLPVLWFLISRYDLVGTAVMVGAESFAVGLETVIYRLLAALSWKRAFMAALLCNVLSYAIGLMA